MTTDYEYRGLMAESWDLLRGDTSTWADRGFYLALVERFGPPVLDVGCGTGRLLLDYLGLGIDVDGVDASPEMLALCRARAAEVGLSPTLYEQRVEDLDLPRRYRTVLVPSSSLQLVIPQDDADRAVRRLADHLTPGGALVAPFMTLWRTGDPLSGSFEKSAVRPDGATIRRLARWWFDPDTACERTEDDYQVLRDGVVTAEERHRRDPATRSYTQEQARRLFEQAGLEVTDVFREFALEPAGPEDATFTLVGRRRTGPIAAIVR